MLGTDFFDRDACAVARDLLGATLRRCLTPRAPLHASRGAEGPWLSATIIETEAYYLSEQASHSSLGRTASREPMWAAPGTLYVYHSRAGDSLNVSAGGPGDAVLIKAAWPPDDVHVIAAMQKLNPSARAGEQRSRAQLCAGQALLCRALDIKRVIWSGRTFDADAFYIAAAAHPRPEALQTARLGIRPDRDAHLPYRFVHAAHAAACSKNPLRRGACEGIDYRLLAAGEPAPRPTHRR